MAMPDLEGNPWNKIMIKIVLNFVNFSILSAKVTSSKETAIEINQFK